MTWLPGRISEAMVAEAVPDVAQRAVSPHTVLPAHQQLWCGEVGVAYSYDVDTH